MGEDGWNQYTNNSNWIGKGDKARFLSQEQDGVAPPRALPAEHMVLMLLHCTYN